jgi:transposase
MARQRTNTSDTIELQNWSFRLYPNQAQQAALGKVMRFATRYWNLLVRNMKVAEKLIKRHQETKLKVEIGKMIVAKNPVGLRKAKINKLIADGLSIQEAEYQLNKKELDVLWGPMAHSTLQVKYALLKTKQMKVASADSGLGSMCELIADRFENTWHEVWKNKANGKLKRGIPKKKLVGISAKNLSAQIQSQLPVRDVWTLPVDKVASKQLNQVNLKLLFPTRLSKPCHKHLHWVEFLQHRPVPACAVIKTMSVVRSSPRPDAIWKVIFTLEIDVAKLLPHEKEVMNIRYNFPLTGETAGIDPGVKTALTISGTNVAPGVVVKRGDPGRPYENSMKRLRVLQRKLDRQTRAANPHCYREDGTFIKNQRVLNRTGGMNKTASALRSLHQYAKNYRADYYHKLVHEILNQFDVVGVGDYSDGSPTAKGKHKTKRKAEYATKGVKRVKGVAAQQTTLNRIHRDNAIGLFRSILVEKAKRSLTPKTIKEIKEAFTTQGCVNCSARTGPKGVSGLSVRQWTCRECGHVQDRDGGSAWNIAQLALETNVLGAGK